MDLRILGTLPDTEALADALTAVAEALGQTVCYHVDGRFHFTLGAGRSIAISADVADRLRIESCLRSTPRSSLWCMVGARDRLVGLVTKMVEEVAEPV